MEFTLSEAAKTFKLKFEKILTEYKRKHFWDIQKEMGVKEFLTMPCISETLMPSC
jgi:hypothetical protein